jgi:hypothetical protein
MLAFFHLLVTFIANLFRSRRRLEVENLFLRHQLNIAMRRAPHRLRLHTRDRALLVLMTWLWPSLLGLSRPGTSRHATSSEIGTLSMARLLYAEFAPWAYATSLSHQHHLGRTVLPKG